MATTEEVKKLAALARIRVDDAELAKFTKEFDAILAYVGQLEKLELPARPDDSGRSGRPKDLKDAKPAVRNIFRADPPAGGPNETGSNTEKLAKQFPEREDDYLVVKQIISHG